MPQSKKVKMQVVEMRDADVEFVSLVARGANRIPFRIKKSDEESPMSLNLSSLSRIFKGAKAPELQANHIVGVATVAVKGEKLEAVKALLVEQGFAVDNAESFEDETMVFKQEGYDAEDKDTSMVRLSDDLVLVVKGFAPYSEEVEGDFLTNVKAQGFYSGLDSATCAFRTSLYMILSDAADQQAAVSEVTTLLSEFSTYVAGLVQAIPTKAFKAELAFAAQKEEATVAAEPVVEPVVEPAVEAAVPAVEPVVESEPVVAVTDEPIVAEPAVEAPVVVEPEPAVKSESTEAALPDTLVEQLSAMTLAMTELTKVVKGVQEEQTSIKQNVDEVARKAEDATKAVKGVVVGSAIGAESFAPSAAVKKSEDKDPRTGSFDTAFLRKR